MKTHFLVQDNGRYGVPLSPTDGANSMVQFKGRPLEPFSVVLAEAPQEIGVPYLETSAWSYDRAWSRLVDVDLGTVDEGEPVPRLDPDLLAGEDRGRFDACSVRVGKVYVVRLDGVEGLVSHYEFASAHEERSWLASAIREGDPLDAHRGKPLRFSADVARPLLDALGEEHLVRSLHERAQAAQEEIEVIDSQRAKARGELEAVQADLVEAQENLSVVREEHAKWEELRAGAERAAEDVDVRVSKQEAHRRTLEEAIQTLRTEEREGRERLQNENKDLMEDHRRLLVAVEEARRRARLEHDREDQRVPILRALPELVDEVEALERLEGLLNDRACFEDLVGLHVAMKHFPFLVLTGPSGSGKSSLLRKYGDALGMYTETIPVQPNWTSVADLHGYVFPIGETRHYVTTAFSRALGMQVEEEEFLSLVVLDEINLAHVEYYLADYLSAFEHDRTVDLASELELESARAPEWIASSKGRVTIPTSFLMAGTANEDHTTRAFSDKFRDRMASFEIGAPTELRLGKLLEGTGAERVAPERLGRVTPEAWARWRELPRASGPNKSGSAFTLATKILSALQEAGIAFGHRQYRDVETFIRAAAPLLAPIGGTAEGRSHRASDLALEMRVLQKSAPLLEAVRDRDPSAFSRAISAVEEVAAQQRKHYPRVLRWVERTRQPR